MVRASDTLAILSAEAPISQPLLTDGGAFYQLLEEFRAAFECSVIDLPRAMLIQHPHLMSDVNVTVVVTEMTLAAARDSIRSEEHTSELQSLMRISSAVFCLKRKT